jgi:cyclic dehypoxanthinyl futalosine synthase
MSTLPLATAPLPTPANPGPYPQFERHPGNPEIERIAAAVLEGTRLSPADALILFADADLHTLAGLATRVRDRHNPPGRVTFVSDRNINYTNVCVTYCSFCAFYRPPGHAEGYVNSDEVIHAKIAEMKAAGGTGILLQGGHHGELPFSYYTKLLSGIKKKFPDIWIHGFSPSEIHHFSKTFNMSVRDVLKGLIDAGLGSLPGGGAEILDDEIRMRVSPLKANTAQWLGVMREAHQLGLKTSMTMMYGHIETPRHIVNHLQRTREMQDETGGYQAFAAWNYQHECGTHLGDNGSTPADYLRIVALARIFLDNIPHIQSSWVTQGLKLLPVSLHYGCDDAGSVMFEENVVSAAGTTHCATEADLRRIITGAGYQPAKRDNGYGILEKS